MPFPLANRAASPFRFLERLRECLKKWQDGYFTKKKHILSCDEQLNDEAYQRLKKQCEEIFGEGNFILLEGGLSYKGMTNDPDRSPL